MTNISGTTRLAGVIGWPIEHTLSPAMHNAAYEALGLDWVYLPLGVHDEAGLRRIAAAARSLPFVGFNVTMPYKQAALELCDDVAHMANMAGAVNTVHITDGKLVGYNTDGRGLLESLESDAGFAVAGKHVVLLGAGGAASSALVAFLLAKAASVMVVNRHEEAAEDLVARVASAGPETLLAYSVPEEARESIESADLVVNATPLGMVLGDPSPVPMEWLHEGQVVYDLVYGIETALVREAKDAGAAAFDGLGMLVCQGATAADIWNGDSELRMPRDVMRSAAEAALATREGDTGQL
jgi:shikimate dehydrogenase